MLNAPVLFFFRRRCAARPLVWGVVAALLASMALLGCSTALFSPNKIVLTEAQLQRQLTASFPVERRLLELFEVRATSPSLQLLPQRNRLAATVDMTARERILGSRLSGKLSFDAGLRWEPSDLSVRLDQVRVQDLALDGSTPPAIPPTSTVKTSSTNYTAVAANDNNSLRRGTLERLGAALAERALEGMTLYRVPEDKRAQLDKAGVQLGTLTVTSAGVEITFQPKAR